MKYILLVPDGLWDVPSDILGNKTPLQVARTPNMDRLALEGVVGRVKTVPDGFPPGSDVANMSLLGYAPEQYYSGRAPIEAANIGVSISDGEVAFRCNLVTIAEGKMVDYSAGHISTQEAEYLIDDLNRVLGSDKVRFYVGTSYRNLLVLKVDKVDDFLSIECWPPHNIIGKSIEEYMPRGEHPEAVKLLRNIMESSIDILARSDVNKVRLDLGENPATMVWLWGQGTGKTMPLFEEKYGLKGAIISAVDLLKGLGKKIGLKVIEVPGATGFYDTNYKGKAEYALEALKDCDFVMVHVEATDEAGHNGEVYEKIKAIERFDALIVGTIINNLPWQEVRILVSPDHPTPVKIRRHTSDPVGFLMWGKRVSPDNSSAYSEHTCEASDLYIPSGPELFGLFIRR